MPHGTCSHILLQLHFLSKDWASLYHYVYVSEGNTVDTEQMLLKNQSKLLSHPHVTNKDRITVSVINPSNCADSGAPFRITTSSPIYKVISSMFCWEFPGDVSWDPKKKFCFLCSDGSCSPHQNTADGLPAVSKFPLYVLPGTALQTVPASPTLTKDNAVLLPSRSRSDEWSLWVLLEKSQNTGSYYI